MGHLKKKKMKLQILYQREENIIFNQEEIEIIQIKQKIMNQIIEVRKD